MNFRNYNKKDELEVRNIFAQYWTDNEFLAELKEELDSEVCKFYIAEKDGEVVGIAGLRKVPDYFKQYTDTKNPAELYIIASKYQNKGIGNFLDQKVTAEAKTSGFTEIVCYSPQTHNDSWRFYENLGFSKEEIINHPEDGQSGMFWKKVI